LIDSKVKIGKETEVKAMLTEGRMKSLKKKLLEYWIYEVDIKTK